MQPKTVIVCPICGTQNELIVTQFTRYRPITCTCGKKIAPSGLKHSADQIDQAIEELRATLR